MSSAFLIKPCSFLQHPYRNNIVLNQATKLLGERPLTEAEGIVPYVLLWGSQERKIVIPEALSAGSYQESLNLFTAVWIYAVCQGLLHPGCSVQRTCPAAPLASLAKDEEAFVGLFLLRMGKHFSSCLASQSIARHELHSLLTQLSSRAIHHIPLPPERSWAGHI